MSQDTVEEKPDYLSPEWSDYVMTFFTEEELVQDPNKPTKYPTTAGLRRVIEILLGRIQSSKPTQVFPVISSSDIRATAVYEIVLRYFDGEYVTYADVADVWIGNTDPFFVSFAIATASTRAEGRALRKALKLRVCAAEEMCKIDPALAVSKNSEDLIQDEQMTLIKRKCKSLDIDIMKLINSGQNTYKGITSVTSDDAKKIIKKLTEFNNDKTLIPDSIKGYSE